MQWRRETDLFCDKISKKKKNEGEWRDSSRRSGHRGSSAGASRSSRPPLASCGGDPPPHGTGPGYGAAAPAPDPSTDFPGAQPTLPPSTAMETHKDLRQDIRGEGERLGFASARVSESEVRRIGRGAPGGGGGDFYHAPGNWGRIYGPIFYRSATRRTFSEAAVTET